MVFFSAARTSRLDLFRSNVFSVAVIFPYFICSSHFILSTNSSDCFFECNIHFYKVLSFALIRHKSVCMSQFCSLSFCSTCFGCLLAIVRIHLNNYFCFLTSINIFIFRGPSLFLCCLRQFYGQMCLPLSLPSLSAPSPPPPMLPTTSTRKVLYCIAFQILRLHCTLVRERGHAHKT